MMLALRFYVLRLINLVDRRASYTTIMHNIQVCKGKGGRVGSLKHDKSFSVSSDISSARPSESA